jgi:hypothetical protein
VAGFGDADGLRRREGFKIAVPYAQTIKDKVV